MADDDNATGLPAITSALAVHTGFAEQRRRYLEMVAQRKALEARLRTDKEQTLSNAEALIKELGSKQRELQELKQKYRTESGDWSRTESSLRVEAQALRDINKAVTEQLAHVRTESRRLSMELDRHVGSGSASDDDDDDVGVSGANVTRRPRGRSAPSKAKLGLGGVGTGGGGGAAGAAGEPVRILPEHRDRLKAFYRTHNPAKVFEIDAILTRWHGKEEHLFTTLDKKYGVVRPRKKEDGEEAPPSIRARLGTTFGGIMSWGKAKVEQLKTPDEEGEETAGTETDGNNKGDEQEHGDVEAQGGGRSSSTRTRNPSSSSSGSGDDKTGTGSTSSSEPTTPRLSKRAHSAEASMVSPGGAEESSGAGAALRRLSTSFNGLLATATASLAAEGVVGIGGSSSGGHSTAGAQQDDRVARLAAELAEVKEMSQRQVAAMREIVLKQDRQIASIKAEKEALEAKLKKQTSQLELDRKVAAAANK